MGGSRKQGARGALAVICAVVLAACSSKSNDVPAADAGDEADAAVPQIAMPTGDPLSWAVDAMGPFHVGHRSIDTTYTPPTGGPRTITVEIWYPSLDDGGDHAKYLGIFADDVAYENASLAPPLEVKGARAGTYPVHLYSHGSSGFPATSFRMADWFASHGWVYVAPTHVGNTLGSPEGKDRPVWLFYVRPTDLTAALDAMEHLPASDPLAGKLRTDHVLLSGHSYGGYTSWISGGAPLDATTAKTSCDAGDFTTPCKPEEIAAFSKSYADPRVIAVVPMAGSDFDWIGDVDLPKVPFLVMSGSLDVSPQPLWDRSKTLDFTWIELQGGCHQVFALGGCPQFDEKLGWKVTNAWALAFGRRYVLGDAGDRTTKILTNAESLTPLIKYQHKGATTPPRGP